MEKADAPAGIPRNPTSISFQNIIGGTHSYILELTINILGIPILVWFVSDLKFISGSPKELRSLHVLHALASTMKACALHEIEDGDLSLYYLLRCR